MGLPAHSICFGALANTGYLARNEAVAAQLDDKGIPPMLLSKVFALLERTLRTDIYSPVIANVRWDKWAISHAGATSARFSGLLHEEGSSTEGESVRGRTVLEEIRSASDPAVPLESTVRDVAARVLRRRTSSDLDSDVSFPDMGMDSMLALEMKNLLERTLERAFPVTLMFRYPTIRKLVEYLVEELGAKPQPGEETSASTSSDVTWIEGEL